MVFVFFFYSRFLCLILLMQQAKAKHRIPPTKQAGRQTIDGRPTEAPQPGSVACSRARTRRGQTLDPRKKKKGDDLCTQSQTLTAKVALTRFCQLELPYPLKALDPCKLVYPLVPSSGARSGCSPVLAYFRDWTSLGESKNTHQNVVAKVRNRLNSFNNIPRTSRKPSADLVNLPISNVYDISSIDESTIWTCIPEFKQVPGRDGPSLGQFCDKIGPSSVCLAVFNAPPRSDRKENQGPHFAVTGRKPAEGRPIPQPARPRAPSRPVHFLFSFALLLLVCIQSVWLLSSFSLSRRCITNTPPFLFSFFLPFRL